MQILLESRAHLQLIDQREWVIVGQITYHAQPVDTDEVRTKALWNFTERIIHETCSATDPEYELTAILDNHSGPRSIIILH